jgi:hypothetical protein
MIGKYCFAALWVLPSIFRAIAILVFTALDVTLEMMQFGNKQKDVIGGKEKSEGSQR